MNITQLQNEILAVLQTIKNDKSKLKMLHEFVMTKIYKEPEPEKIPDKYQKAITEIVDNLLTGFICFFNPSTLEVEYLPKKLVYDPEEYELMTGETWESAGIKHEDWEKCIEIEPMESHDSFKIMEHFINEVDDSYLQNQLINALNRHKPFANFKHIVENSTYRQQWFDFRQKQCEYYVWDIVQNS